MYKITKVEDHYEVVLSNDKWGTGLLSDKEREERINRAEIITEVKLTGNSETELKGLIRMIAEETGVAREIYNSAIQDCINKLKEDENKK